MGIVRFFYIPIWPLNTWYDGDHPGTIVMNLLWVCFNMVILGVAVAVAWENQQRRQTVRVTMAVQADIQFANGTVVQGVTADMSSGGAMINVDHDVAAAAGETVRITFPVLDGDATLPATVIGIEEQCVARTVRSADAAGRRGVDDGALLACRYLAGLGRVARGGSSAAEPGAYLPAFYARVDADITRFDEDEEGCAAQGKTCDEYCSAAADGCVADGYRPEERNEPAGVPD